MKYSRYEEYKESGVVWLGEIPQNWTVQKLKFIADVMPSNVDKKSNENESAVTLCNYTDVYYHEEITHEIDFMKATATWDQIRKFQLKKGDVIITKDSEDPNDIAVPAYVPKDMEGVICGYHLAILRHRKELNGRYLKRVMDTHYTRCVFATQANGLTRYGLGTYAINNFILPLPPHEEQNKIATFLDKETLKIDTLIEKQEQLIKLLEEKRQAMISHTVTKGLNRDVKMKDSGVEWLGDIPEQWDIKKFGHISVVVRGASPRPAGDPSLFHGNYSPWVTVAEITKDNEIYLKNTETYLTLKGSEQSRVFKQGTLILSNSGATLGVPKILAIDANGNDGVVGFEHLNSEVCPEYAYFVLSVLTDNLRERIKQGSGQPNLNTDIVKNIQIPVPPKYEQLEIIAFIHSSREAIDQLSQKLIRFKDLLIERRRALITAAVTGKIDVRSVI